MRMHFFIFMFNMLLELRVSPESYLRPHLLWAVSMQIPGWQVAPESDAAAAGQRWRGSLNGPSCAGRSRTCLCALPVGLSAGVRVPVGPQFSVIVSCRSATYRSLSSANC